MKGCLKRAVQSAGALLLAAALAGGCRGGAPKASGLGIGIYQAVGEITWVSPNGKSAVLRLQDNVGAKGLPEGLPLLARDEALEPVATLETTPIRQGRTAGLACTSGEVRLGDIVYLVEPLHALTPEEAKAKKEAEKRAEKEREEKARKEAQQAAKPQFLPQEAKK